MEIQNLKLNKNYHIKNYLKDHRVFMMSCIAALSLGGKWKINDKDSINTSFPNFSKNFKKFRSKNKLKKKLNKKIEFKNAADGSSASGKTTGGKLIAKKFKYEIFYQVELYIDYCALKTLENKNKFNIKFIKKIANSITLKI